MLQVFNGLTILLACATLGWVLGSTYDSMTRFDYEDMAAANVVVNGNCSGTVVDAEHGLILSAAHCFSSRKVGSKEQISVVRSGEGWDGEAKYVATVEAIDHDVDLALLQYDGDGIPGVKTPELSCHALEIGDDIWAMGNPAGNKNSLLKGIVSSVHRSITIDRSRNYVQVDPGLVGGISGGAMYDEYGELVGVPAAGMPGTVIGASVPIKYVREMMQSWYRSNELNYTAAKLNC